MSLDALEHMICGLGGGAALSVCGWFLVNSLRKSPHTERYNSMGALWISAGLFFMVIMYIYNNFTHCLNGIRFWLTSVIIAIMALGLLALEKEIK